MSSPGLPLSLSCSYDESPCNFDKVISGEGAPVIDTKGKQKKDWLKGFVMKKGTVLYVGCLAGADPWWEKSLPQKQGGLGPFFSTSLKRVRKFGGAVLEYRVKEDTHLLFTATSGGFETQEDVFGKEYGDNFGYFSCKECEVSVRNGNVSTFVEFVGKVESVSNSNSSASSSSTSSTAPPSATATAPAASSSSTPRPKIKKD